MPGTHLLVRRQVIPLTREEVFPFFADAANLERITPPELHFRILTPLPLTIQRGSYLDYQLSLWRFPIRWRTLIQHWDPPGSFVDKQIRGPYALWVHEHTFVDLGEKTEMTDRVQYALPLWPVGELALPLVRMQLDRIFDYRSEVISRVFGTVHRHDAPDN